MCANSCKNWSLANCLSTTISLRKADFSGGFGENGAQPELETPLSVRICSARIEFLIGTAPSKEFQVAAAGHHAPLFKHNNSISPRDRRRSVGNKKNRAVFAILFQPLHKKRRSKAVESSCDFIQYQDSGLLQQSPRQGDSFLFSSGKLSSQRSKRLIETCWQAQQQIFELRQLYS